MSQPKDQVLNDIRGKIDREVKLIQGFQAVKRSTSNQEVIQRCNNQIRETQTNIDYLKETLEKLLVRGDSEPHSSAESNPNRSRVTSMAKPLYSRFDLIKYDCPSLGHKIQYMLQQLHFKLQVENQYKAANEKISHLYLMDGDKLSSSAAEGGKLESDQRIQLLNKSLKKYQGMHVSVEEISRDLEIMNTPKFARKPLTGRLIVYITCIRDVDHIALPMFNKKPESFVSIKVDDVEKARTNGSRAGKFNEEFIIEVDKAHEMEVTVYDKSGAQNVPVALTWVLLSDIAEEIRKKKVANEAGSEMWIPALSMPLDPTGRPQPQQLPSHGSGSSGSGFDGATVVDNNQHNNHDNKTVQIAAWVNLEPVGQILINLSFEKSQSVGKSNFMGALGRHGAIRQKKEEVFEQHGHQFVQKQFYNIMCCALCGEFLRYTGFQCQDCRFLCHKKCYQKVVTKCILKSSTTYDDEDKLNHRIPHRFEPILNRGTKWCCHCGHILPWGKKNVRKCSECGVMCHTQCTHLVPDFCGMSMEMANKILTTIKSTKPTKQTGHKLGASSTNASPVRPRQSPQLLPSKPLPHRPQDRPQPNQRLQSQYQEVHQQQAIPNYPQHQSYNADYQDQRGRAQHKSRPILGADIDVEEEYNARLPTQASHQFQPVVESPYARQTPNRRPPPPPIEAQTQQPAEELQYSGHEHQYQPQHGYDHPASHEAPVADSLNPFNGQVPTQDPRDRDSTIFNSFDYSNALSRLQDDPDSAMAENIISQQPSASTAHSEPSSESNHRSHRLRRRRRKVGLDDFQFLAVLGKGNFGKVMLAESRHTQKLCAIKVLKKDFIVENEEAESVKSEKRVFLTANKEMHPFLLNLHCCFQTENRIYFVMEFVSGGDLMWHIQKSRFSARRAKFYACEVLLALKYFHDNGIVYRDLKLDNILLTTKGHIKIADYGLCKENMWHGSTTGTFCGTPEFMAPEIIASKPYTRAVDWWAFGILMFQMLLCQSPFKGSDEDDIFNAIEHDDVRYPINMPRQTVLVLQALLTKEPSERLGSGERDALEIMEHLYFLDVNFDDVLNMRIQPPYLPEVTSEHDYSNFDQEFTSETPRLTPVDTVLTSEMQEQFRGFSHISDDAPV